MYPQNPTYQPQRPPYPYQPQQMPQYQPQPLRAQGPAMTYNEPVSPLVQTMAQRNAEIIENKKKTKKQKPNKKMSPSMMYVIIGSCAVVIIALLVTLIVVMGGKDRGTQTASNDTTESTFGGIGSDITDEEEASEYYASRGNDYEIFNIGETWTVDGQWSLTILGAKKTEERNKYSDKEPEAVYIVDYIYTNIGYDDSIMDGVFFSLDDTIIDSKGRYGYSYLGNVTHYAQAAPLGATCIAQACIGLDHDGTFRISMSKYDNDAHPHNAEFIIDPSKEAYDVTHSSIDTADAPTLEIGETWTVDGQWSITVTGVREAERRNDFSDKNPEKIYLVEYTYTNLGYEDDFTEGLYITVDDMVVDSKGVMGYSYPGDIKEYPKPIQVGETLKAESCIGVENAGDFRVSIIKYDGNKNKQKETFMIKVN
ncbi:MAG: hypothetical protein J6O17_02300 [Eubacterium sp.]|nr:hypothetical protein [Eubacterium sp.]